MVNQSEWVVLRGYRGIYLTALDPFKVQEVKCMYVKSLTEQAF